MALVRIARLVGRELRLLGTDWRLLFLLVGVPVFFTLLFAGIYAQKRVTAIPTWVVDQDGSALSRQVHDAIARHETFRIVREGGTNAEFRAATERAEAFVCIWIPPHFERDVKDGKPVRLLTFIDGNNMLVSNSATRAITEIGLTYAAGVSISRLARRGVPAEYLNGSVQPVELQTRVWDNPTFNYLNFLIPGLIAAALQQVTLLPVALAFARERGLRLADARAISRSPGEFLLAKLFVYTAVSTLMGVLTYSAIGHYLGVPMLGSGALLWGILALFMLGLVATGLLVSVATQNELFATQLLMFVAVPSFLVSGFTWPQFAMYPVVRALSNAMPLTHFVLPLRAITQQGATLAAVRPHVLWLWVFDVLVILAAYLVVRARLRAPSPEPAPA
jgi:ABC-2 type transport system permease protein